ncbi:EF-hand domain-containing protein [Mameliella alba]|uniref:Calcium-binding EF-hand-containing protein n=1 Tax=Mameliella alba TaxID=561184 RepID=A0A0B3RL99_9RHOB|nr:calcium-binding protein [Mameliella alba]KHQ52005.1 Calcium-binding EF-hand-containing protein [Mameliella alba]
MKMQARMALSALVVAATAGAAVAHGDGERNGRGHHDWHGGQDIMQMMMRGHGMMGAYGGMPGMGMMGIDLPMMGRMPMMGGMYGGLGRMLDEDGDGTVTPEEVRSGLDGLRTEYDANGDGWLSIDEFEALHSALIRESMVDRFQYLDADGDGHITEEEMQAPAALMDHMQSWRDRMMDHDGYGPGRMMPGAEGVRPGQGHMMDDVRPGMQGRQGN